MDFKSIESKWQQRWADAKLFEVSEDSKKEKFYLLEMFPYPSGSGLHMGHALNFVIGDVLARKKIMDGFNVLHPMGFDALGLPAENAAIKAGTHPQDYTDKAIEHYIEQQKALGITYDWNRVVNTADPKYYKWDQWIFLKMLEKKLVYQKESSVNWCPKCDTVLANEQVQGGKCWRHDDTEVETKNLKQWFLKITNYADELYEGIDKLEGWPAKTRAMQKNWIGKSHGVDIYFKLENSDKIISTFTTRCDTIYSVTFLAIAPEHPMLDELIKDVKNASEIKNFAQTLTRESLADRINEEKEKKGIFTGVYAINPASGEKVPLYVANFALMYGSGIVMCDAHDKRDFAFAKNYKIPLKFVISKDGKEVDASKASNAFVDNGILFGSGEFNGINNQEALPKMADWLQKQKKGKKVVNFKLRDWGISRQRYWGTPIPMIHCEKCGAVPVPEKDLPVALPKDVSFGKGNPLETNEAWIKTKCPKCKGEGRRETDTMDTFVNSSWYFLRYADPTNDEEIFDKKKAKYWCPIDQYIGGAEHACMHLIYSRFYTKFLADIGLINFREPAKKLFHQGMLAGEGGIKMSKSKGNVVLPEVVSEKYGIDTARLFLLSLAAPDKPRDWSENGIQGSLKVIQRIFDYFQNLKIGKDSNKNVSKINKMIKEVSEDIESFSYNLAIIKIRQFFESIENEQISKDTTEKFLKILAPFCPHLSEELWEKIGNKPFISNTPWPKYDEKLIDESLEKIEGVVDTLRNDILKIKELAKLEKVSKVKIFVAPKWKWKALEIVKKACGGKPDFGLAIKSLMENNGMKKHGKEVQPFLKAVMGRFGELQDLEEFDEVKTIEEIKPQLEKEFGIIEIIKAEESQEAKAKNAFPAKPALLVE